MRNLRRAVPHARAIMTAPAMTPLSGERVRTGRRSATDDKILDWLKRRGNHLPPCRPLQDGIHDPRAVVDAHLRVHGIAGLRVRRCLDHAGTLTRGNTRPRRSSRKRRQTDAESRNLTSRSEIMAGGYRYPPDFVDTCRHCVSPEGRRSPRITKGIYVCAGDVTQHRAVRSIPVRGVGSAAVAARIRLQPYRPFCRRQPRRLQDDVSWRRDAPLPRPNMRFLDGGAAGLPVDRDLLAIGEKRSLKGTE